MREDPLHIFLYLLDLLEIFVIVDLIAVVLAIISFHCEGVDFLLSNVVLTLSHRLLFAPSLIYLYR